jgi:4-hydroxy-3-methylbut-2-en-1-yl diphosphate synthase IspG/GcpE
MYLEAGLQARPVQLITVPATARLHKTVGVRVGHVQVGGGAPFVVQSMTMTDTADAKATAQQCIELA